MERAVYSFHTFPEYIRYLCDKQRVGNPAFSHLKWARKLGYKSERSIGMVLKGHRLPSSTMLLAISRQEKHTLPEKRYLHLLAELERRRQKKKAMDDLIAELAEIRNQRIQRTVIDNESFALISEWYHFAIKSMIHSPGFREDPSWISARLRKKVKPRQVKEAIERMLKLGVLGRDGRTGALCVPDEMHLGTQRNVPSRAIREHNRQMMALAIEAIEEQPVLRRTISTRTLPIRIEQYEEATRFLYDFLDQFAARYYDTNSTQVYQLNLQLFELTDGPVSR